ncbi:MAG: hypothetical protein GXP47_02405 [Acidobacteria bacterium]|nr:hypothetical protein [Acidobacteriota bacterium]
MRLTRLCSVVLLALLVACVLPAAQEHAVISSFSNRGGVVTARGGTPSAVEPGSLAAAVDSAGHVMGILRFLSRSGPKLRLETVEPLWPGSVRKGLELRFFDTTGGHGLAVWTEVWGAALEVDGRKIARLPALLSIRSGTHTFKAALPGGVVAAARAAAPVTRDSLCLHGIGWPLGDEPAVKLTANPVPDPTAPLTWVEVPQLGRFYHAGGAVTLPKKQKTVLPEYPAQLRQMHTGGWAVFLVLVGSDGAVQAVARTAWSDTGFAVAGTRALRRWTFTPAVLDGQPVGGIFPVTLRWELSPGPH